MSNRNPFQYNINRPLIVFTLFFAILYAIGVHWSPWVSLAIVAGLNLLTILITAFKAQRYYDAVYGAIVEATERVHHEKNS